MFAELAGLTFASGLVFLGTQVRVDDGIVFLDYYFLYYNYLYFYRCWHPAASETRMQLQSIFTHYQTLPHALTEAGNFDMSVRMSNMHVLP